MRDYALFQAEQSLQLPGGGLLLRLFTNWKARRAVRQLEDLDDFLLRDIGLSRNDVIAVADLPLTHNAIEELQEAVRGNDQLRPARVRIPALNRPRIQNIPLSAVTGQRTAA